MVIYRNGVTDITQLAISDIPTTRKRVWAYSPAPVDAE